MDSGYSRSFNNHMIDFENGRKLKIFQNIYSSNGNQVYYGILEKNKKLQQVAVKVLNVARFKLTHTQSLISEQLNKEGQYLKRLKENPYVIKFLCKMEIVKDKDTILPALVIKWCNGGSLYDRLKQSPLHVDQAEYIAKEIMKGFKLLVLTNSQGKKEQLLHRDIKSSNILFHREKKDDKYKVMIADLGVAKSGNTKTQHLGTAGYMSPEMVRYNDRTVQYGEEVDVWSFGVLLYQMVVSQKQFQQYKKKITQVVMEKIVQQLKNNNTGYNEHIQILKLQQKYNISEKYKNLIKSCFMLQPSLRTWSNLQKYIQYQQKQKWGEQYRDRIFQFEQQDYKIMTQISQESTLIHNQFIKTLENIALDQYHQSEVLQNTVTLYKFFFNHWLGHQIVADLDRKEKSAVEKFNDLQLNAMNIALFTRQQADKIKNDKDKLPTVLGRMEKIQKINRKYKKINEIFKDVTEYGTINRLQQFDFGFKQIIVNLILDLKPLQNICEINQMKKLHINQLRFFLVFLYNHSLPKHYSDISFEELKASMQQTFDPRMFDGQLYSLFTTQNDHFIKISPKRLYEYKGKEQSFKSFDIQ